MSPEAIHSPEVDFRIELPRNYMAWVFGNERREDINQLTPGQMLMAGEFLADLYTDTARSLGLSEELFTTDAHIIQQRMSGVTDVAIANELGITKGVVAHHIKNTYKLMREVNSKEELDSLLDYLAALMPEAVEEDPVVEAAFPPRALARAIRQGQAARQPKLRERKDLLPRRGRRKASDEVDTFGEYMNDMGRYPLLNKEQEVALSKSIHAGMDAAKQLAEAPKLSARERRQLRAAVREGEEAKEQLILSNLRLVVSEAKKYQVRIPLPEAIQEGNFGLMHAAEKFDGSKGFKFSTYATWWIRQSISRAISNNSRTIRLPVHADEVHSRVIKARARLEDELGRPATLAEIAERLEMTEDKEKRRILDVLRGGSDPLSLDAPISDDGKISHSDLVGDVKASAAIDEFIDRHTAEEFIECLREELEAREFEVLVLHYGLGGGRIHTYEEISRILNISRGTVGNIEATAKAKLLLPTSAAASFR